MAEQVAQPRWDKFLFKEALELQPEWGCILEIGAIRDIRPVAARSDGHSTVEWSKAERKVICIDIEENAINAAKRLVGETKYVEFVHANAFEYLCNPPEEPLISLLYLDGPHPKTEDGAQFALDCFIAAHPYTDVGTVVLIDDCDVSPGKGDLVIPYAESHGWSKVMVGLRQVILVRVQALALEDFDKRKAVPKVGLVGYTCHTGLGELNRQIDDYCDLELWLEKSHSHWENGAIPAKVRRLSDSVVGCVETTITQSDVLLFCEMPYFLDLIPKAKAAGKRLVCVPMYEWLPKGKWTTDVDLFICPTKQCYDELKDELPCVYFPWPVDTNRFKFVERNKVDRFLFINGRGGWNGRKGWECVRQALQIWPEMPLTIISQVDLSLPNMYPNVKILPSVVDNNDLYMQGDVLIVPHTVDGLGLEPHEAMACGMPVIVPNAVPWTESPHFASLSTTAVRQRVGRDIDWHICSPKQLAEVCQGLTMADDHIGEASILARKWAETRSWDNKKQEFMNLVRGLK